MKVALLPLGRVPPELVARVADGLASYGIVGDVLAGRPMPDSAYDAGRGQFRAEDVLSEIGGAEDSVLAVTPDDLFAEGLEFVFGLATIGEGCAVVSTHRLGSEDGRQFEMRTLKECVHEIGHLLGLPHCDDAACVMAFSNSLAEADAKGPGFCAGCASRAPGLHGAQAPG